MSKIGLRTSEGKGREERGSGSMGTMSFLFWGIPLIMSLLYRPETATSEAPAAAGGVENVEEALIESK